MIPPREQLDGLSYERAELMGKPHLGARYIGVKDRYKVEFGAVCAVCGSPATEAHHIVPKGAGSGSGVFVLRTKLGVFTMRSPLFALCRACHRRFHDKDLTVRWEWDGDYMEGWWSGRILSHGFTPHSPRLLELGRYVIEARDRGAHGTRL